MIFCEEEMKCGAGFNALGIDWIVKSGHCVPEFCFPAIAIRTNATL